MVRQVAIVPPEKEEVGKGGGAVLAESPTNGANASASFSARSSSSFASSSSSSLKGRANPPSLPTAADFYVPAGFPGFSSSSSNSPSSSSLGKGRLSIYAGNLPSSITSNPPAPTDSDAHLYFLLTRSRHIPKRPRLIIWFNGGPGCSSFDGSLIEIGPVRVNEDGYTVREVEHAWNEYANVLFLDQPAGTGYSYVTKHDDVRELAAAAEQVVIFLLHLYEVFPEFKTMDTYLAGESYAGQYIPYIADAIFKTTLVETPLKGLLIGNGWISPRDQYPAYLTYAVERGLLKKGSAGFKQVQKSVDACTVELDKMYEKDPTGRGTVLVGVCEEILNALSQALLKDTLCINSYDTSQYHVCGTEWPPDLVQVTKYLRNSTVTEALHAGPGSVVPWTQCDPTVGSHFWTPSSQPSVNLLPSILERIPILLFNGERDMMCAGTGIEIMISNLEWNGETGFTQGKNQSTTTTTTTSTTSSSEALEWIVDGVRVGDWTTERNLTYVRVYNASHMVPMDQPAAAHDMLLRFMQVDTLHAAGHAATVPSRIGKETEAVLGATHPNGTTLEGVAEAAAASASAKASVKDVTLDGFDKDHELLYGPRRTAVLVFMLAFVGFIFWMFFRWRGRRRVRERYRRVGNKTKRTGSVLRLEESLRSSKSKRGSNNKKGAVSLDQDSNVSGLPMGSSPILPSYHDQKDRPLTTSRHQLDGKPIFDIGDEDLEEGDFDIDEEENDEDEDERDLDPELEGDLGSGLNPWKK